MRSELPEDWPPANPVGSSNIGISHRALTEYPYLTNSGAVSEVIRT